MESKNPQEDDNLTEELVKLEISKKQQKKALRREKWLECRPERRKLEKEKRKLKRKVLAQERDNSDVIPTYQKRYHLMSESENKFRVVIDMDFETFMTDNEMGKSVQQVGRIYAANRKAENPCQLYITSLTGKCRERFSVTNRGFENWDINHSELNYRDLFRNSGSETTKFIYLTGDSEEDLPEVDDLLRDHQSTVFIIGGLVDHNRHKSLCYDRAKELGIMTARLPITKYVKLSQRHILSTVTVFEILLQVFGNHKQWSDALLECIPKRKIAEPLSQPPSPG